MGLRKLIEMHRARKKAKEFGRRMPDTAMTTRILEAVQKKVTYPKEELLKMRGDNAWEALELNVRGLKSEMHLQRKPILSRIATKYALDAAGLSVKYDKEKREAVHKVMAEVVEKTERLTRIIGAENVGLETQIGIVNDASLKLNKILGKERAREFIDAYTTKAAELYRLAKGLPIKLV